MSYEQAELILPVREEGGQQIPNASISKRPSADAKADPSNDSMVSKPGVADATEEKQCPRGNKYKCVSFAKT